MTIIEIIDKKRNRQELTKEEIAFAINSYVQGTVADYQMSALLMAIAIQGMSDTETADLTGAMLASGDQIDLSDIPGIKVDKHSTGGVGDKTTLILGPLVASCGMKMAKMSGRGLGHTGGTIDKLESITGFQVSLSEEEFHEQVRNIGLAVVSQTGNLVPADKKLYALRDVTGTVESIPLIASSIMSKKLASGADILLIDVKVGAGALMKTYDDASKLAHLMVKIGVAHGKKTICVLSNMNEPLGMTIGNGLEVKESIQVLKGEGAADLTELAVTLATLLSHYGKDQSLETSRAEVLEQLKNGKAYAKFLEFVFAQHGDIEQIMISPKVLSLKSKKTGYLNKIDALGLGQIARHLGAGRFLKEDGINYGVGMRLKKKVGDYVLEDEELVELYFDQQSVSIDEVLNCFTITESFVEPEPLIYEVVTS